MQQIILKNHKFSNAPYDPQIGLKRYKLSWENKTSH